MKSLVTGCAGFIGWKVTELLLEHGHSVVGIDNLNDAYDLRLKEWRLSQLKTRPNFTLHQLDISNLEAVGQVFHGARFDGVFNLAARAGVRSSLTDPWVYIDTNIVGTLNLLELSRKHGAKKFILSSTSSVYGEGDRPFREDAQADKPLSPYAASKKAAEALCYSYHHIYGMDITVFRYFTVYGPAGRPDMAVFRFIKWIMEREPLMLHGDGNQERDFTYVDDIARGTISALSLSGFEIINLGNNQPITVNDLIGILEGFVGEQALIERGPQHTSDVSATWAEISKAENLLGWKPQTNLESGLQQAVEWYRQNREWAKNIPLG